MPNNKCGTVTLIGRTNVGKSTLFNSFLKMQLSIVTKKANTTIHYINGIKNIKTNQIIFLDTPGLTLNKSQKNKYTTDRYITNALLETHIILLIIEATKLKKEDLYLLDLLKNSKKPIILIINKIDKIKNKTTLLPFISNISKNLTFHHIIPISAKYNPQTNTITQHIINILPKNKHIYDNHVKSNITKSFVIKEIIRKNLITKLHNEIPHTLNIKLEKIKFYNNLYILTAIIQIKKPNHKAIILGKNGTKIKQIGTLIKKDLEQIFKKNIYIQLIIKKTKL